MIAKFDAKNRVSVRNLRIREDTAKYLRNLNVNSAYYDPKTRTMRSNPYEGNGVKHSDLPYAGDNFIRYTDEVVDISRRQVFAWDASSKGEELHSQADPTLAEVMHKRHKKEKDTFKDTQQNSVISMYGGEEHLQAPPRELLLAQSEHYVEYSKQGRVIKGEEKSAVKSKYIEDTHPGNHTVRPASDCRRAGILVGTLLFAAGAMPQGTAFRATNAARCFRGLTAVLPCCHVVVDSFRFAERLGLVLALRALGVCMLPLNGQGVVLHGGVWQAGLDRVTADQPAAREYGARGGARGRRGPKVDG